MSTTQTLTEKDRRIAQGERVLMARSAARLSRAKFAEAISGRWESISREYVRRIEEGDKDPGVGFFLAAADVTGQPIEWFTEAALHNVDPRHTTWAGSPIGDSDFWGSLDHAA